MSDITLTDIPDAPKTNSPLRYYGGKGNRMKKILPFIPYNKIYIEPYGGGASVLFARKKSEVEVYNDIDGNLINFFRILQNESKFDILSKKLNLTLYSYEEFCSASKILKDETSSDIDKAWAIFVHHNQTISGKIFNPDQKSSWSRNFGASNGMARAIATYLNRVENLEKYYNRLRTVQIEHRDGINCIKYWDHEDAVIYIDPPYPPESRKSKSIYRQEATNNDWHNLIETVVKCKAAIVVSTYPSKICEEFLDYGWSKNNISTVCHATGRNRGGKFVGINSNLRHGKRTEVIWRNKKAILECNDTASVF